MIDPDTKALKRLCESQKGEYKAVPIKISAHPRTLYQVIKGNRHARAGSKV